MVDDGSSTLAALENLDRIETHDFGRPLRVVRQENQYLGAARNTGVRHATGDLIAFVDDDDVVEKTYVSAMVQALEATGADVVTVAIHGFESDDAGIVADGADRRGVGVHGRRTASRPRWSTRSAGGGAVPPVDAR